MIVRVTMLDEKGEPFTMLFGNSYKNWETQLYEYLCIYIKWWDDRALMECKVYGIVSVEKTDSKWKSWGGLKWCRAEHFQKELNREGVQDNEPDNPKPRQYSEMIFRADSKLKQRVIDAYRKRMRHLSDASPEEIKRACASWDEQAKGRESKAKDIQ